MFYNKKIKIYNKSKYKDEFGITHNNFLYLKDEIKADIQPFSQEKVLKEYGYDLQCTKRIFCDLNDNIKESSIVEYKDKFYDIKKIIEWDDYLDIAIIEHKGDIEIE